jgi:thiosulfate/3-mercaptopyruvate sulfurtransferase
MTFGPLVDTNWLLTHLGDTDVRLIDFRWHLMGPDGRDQYLHGHIPGAVFIDLEAVTGKEGAGRHPLPTAKQFELQMRKAGINSTTLVVVYDDEGGSVAARLWFLLGWFGHETQAVLDGGLQAWGGPLETDIPHVHEGDFRSREPDQSRVLDFEAVAHLGGIPLLDARVAPRYRGETEPVDPKAGHIPGALSVPWQENLGPEGRFKSPAELRQQYADLGALEGAVAYCGSGVTSCHHLLAMEVAGLQNARLYAGSWSDWSRRDAPVATGAEPG